jgi:hypothetical protein
MIDVIFTIEILIVVIIAFLVITAWDEVIDRTIIQFLNLDKDSIITWLIIAAIATLILIIIIILFDIELHDLFGVSETVDVRLTGQSEKVVDGRIVHY